MTESIVEIYCHHQLFHQPITSNACIYNACVCVGWGAGEEGVPVHGCSCVQACFHVLQIYVIIIFSTNLSLVMLVFVVCVCACACFCVCVCVGGYVFMHAIVYMHVCSCI